MNSRIHMSAALAVLASTFAADSASAQESFQTGVLYCELVGRTNVVVYSNETFSCVFNPNNGDLEEYEGSITRIGVDLEWKPEQELVWFVFAPTRDVPDGALAGSYGGVSASASVVGGVGTKILLGGSKQSISLQPISIAGSAGLGASAGIEGLRLAVK